MEELTNLGMMITHMVQNNPMHADIAENSLQHIKSFITKTPTEIPNYLSAPPPQTVRAMPTTPVQMMPPPAPYPMGYTHGMIPAVVPNPLPALYPKPMNPPMVMMPVHHM